MEDMGIVQGHKAQAQPLVVGLDTVYVHTDIRLIDEARELYEYHEVQYTHQEYTELLAQSIRVEGMSMANLKLSDMQKSMMIENLGKALAQARLDIMQLKAKS